MGSGNKGQGNSWKLTLCSTDGQNVREHKRCKQRLFTSFVFLHVLSIWIAQIRFEEQCTNKLMNEFFWQGNTSFVRKAGNVHGTVFSITRHFVQMTFLSQLFNSLFIHIVIILNNGSVCHYSEAVCINSAGNLLIFCFSGGQSLM